MNTYEKAYKEALERAKKNYDTAQDLCESSQIGVECFKNTLTNIFPELKESEDEKIRKRLIDLIYKVYAFTNYITCVEYENIIAWLEKQGDTTSDIRYDGVNAGASLSVVNGNSFDYEKATITQKDFASVGETATIELSSPIDCGDRIYHVSHKPIEKQGEQKPAVTDFNAKDWYVSKVDGKIHDMTYNPADKVEPKFKVGDWVVDNRTGVIHYIANIKGTVNGCYYVFGNDKGLLHIDNEEDYHLWTIQDAKDGDILVDSLSGDNQITILFKSIELDTSIRAYIGWNCYNFRVTTDGTGYGTLSSTKYVPATKEQRELLFQKMKEAGYQWDAEKKELKLLITNGGDFEPKQEWSEEDENYLQSAENACEYQYGKNTSTILWLKSLKDRIICKNII